MDWSRIWRWIRGPRRPTGKAEETGETEATPETVQAHEEADAAERKYWEQRMQGGEVRRLARQAHAIRSRNDFSARMREAMGGGNGG